MRTILSLLSLISLVSCTAQTVPPDLRLAVISDLHVSMEADSREIFDSAMVRIAQQHPDVLLVTGDLTDRGDSTSHRYVAESLSRLTEDGTRVFVIPGNHDLYGSSASPEDFAQYYHACGYDEAVMRDTASLSYLVYLRDDLALLCLDSTRPMEGTTRHSDGGLTTHTLQWAKNATDEATLSNHRVIAMMHHQAMEHFDRQSMLAANYVANTDTTYYPALSQVHEQFIPAVSVVFTGHFHIQSAQHVTNERGTLTDVSTGSLANYPSPIRWATLPPNDTLSITTENLTLHRDQQLARNEAIAQTFFRRGVNKVFPKIGRAKQKLPRALTKLLRLPESAEQMQADVTERFLPVALEAYNALAQGDEELHEPDALYAACHSALNEYLLYICKGNKIAARMLRKRLAKSSDGQEDYLEVGDSMLRSVLYNYRESPENVVSDNTIEISLNE